MGLKSGQMYLEPPYLIVVSPGQDAVDSWLQQRVCLVLLPQVCNPLLVITWWSGGIRTISCKQGFLVHPQHSPHCSLNVRLCVHMCAHVHVCVNVCTCWCELTSRYNTVYYAVYISVFSIYYIYMYICIYI